MLYFFSLLLLSLAVCSHLLAAEQCSVSIFHAPPTRHMYGSDVQWVVSRQQDACTIHRIAIPNYACSIDLGWQHGYAYFSCGSELKGLWGIRPDSFKFSPTNDPATGGGSVIWLPEHAALRKEWLAPVDAEGVGSDTDPKAYVAAYPRRFTSVGKQRDVGNPEIKALVQTLRYLTMKNEERAAVTGEAAFGCLKLYFVTWVKPSVADSTEKDMASMLKDMHLEAVEGPSKVVEQACAGKRRFYESKDQ